MSAEVRETFDCFGSTCTVVASGGAAADAVAAARASLLGWHEQFSRFLADSELTRLNDDPRDEVPASALMGRFVEELVAAAERTGGLVDGTLLREIEHRGYRDTLGAPVPLRLALRLAPRRRPAAPNRAARWREVAYDPSRGVVRRPAGVGLDSGGIAKGLFADLLADALADHDAFAVDCAGDLRLGGTAGHRRRVEVQSPFEDRVLHVFELAGGGVATSGIGRRSWIDPTGAPAHHLLDPATGAPAFTGVVQATALAPTALEAEVRAKAAVLSGPRRAADRLPDGGVIVRDDGSVEVVASGRRESGAAGPSRAAGPPRASAA